MSSNLSDVRRDIIAGRLSDGRPVVAAALAAEFGVSEDSIRRDLRTLSAEGRCRRVYGGAMPVAPAAVSMAERAGEARERKRALARAARELIEPGELLFLDHGSTNLALANLLPEDKDLTVATSSVAIAAALCGRSGIRLLVVGGVVDPHIGGCVDAAAILAVQQMLIDRCFLGVCGFSPEQGISAFHLDDALFKRALIDSSRHVAAMVSTEKLNTSASHRVAAISRVEAVVLEHDATLSDRTALSALVTTVLLAEAAG